MQIPANFIPEFPFNDLVFNNYQISGPANPDDPATRLVCGMQFGSMAGNNPGTTAGGLFGILNGIFALDNIINYGTYDEDILLSQKFIINKDFFRVTLGSRYGIVIRNVNTLLANLDNLHNNIASIISHFDPQHQRYDTNGGSETYFSTLSQAFTNFTNYNFPGSYTGLTDAQNPKNSTAPRGNGITGAFVVYDQGSSKWQLSRAGVELATLINYLSYGGIAVVAPTWGNLNSFRSNSQANSALLSGLIYDVELDTNGEFNTFDYVGNLDCVISLDMNGGIERRELGTGPNRNVYGALPETYASGNSFGFAYGLTASQLINEFALNAQRGTFLNTIYGFGSQSSSNVYKDIIPVIHAGLSGSDISLQQNTLTSDLTFTDVQRYGGLNGDESLRPLSTSTSAGLTLYTLTTADLEKTMCVIGKKHKKVVSTYFGDPINNYELDMVTPLVGDVAGLLQKNKENPEIGLYGPAIGPINGKISNATFIEPSIDPAPTNDIANNLRGKKINFVYEDVNQGYFLATELVGATVGVKGTIDANSRFGTAWLKRALRRDVETVLNEFISGGNFVNNESNRSLVTKAVTTVVNNYRNPYLDSTHTPIIQCDGFNNTNNGQILTVAITIKPKSVVYEYQGPNPATFVNTISLTITAVGAAYGTR